MGITFQIVSVILIIGAVLLFWKRTSSNTIITKGQKALSVFQIVLCGGFFALCLSDALDISANFSAVRFFLNIFYALAFLSLTAFASSALLSSLKSGLPNLLPRSFFAFKACFVRMLVMSRSRSARAKNNVSVKRSVCGMSQNMRLPSPILSSTSNAC